MRLIILEIACLVVCPLLNSLSAEPSTVPGSRAEGHGSIGELKCSQVLPSRTQKSESFPEEMVVWDGNMRTDSVYPKERDGVLSGAVPKFV